MKRLSAIITLLAAIAAMTPSVRGERIVVYGVQTIYDMTYAVQNNSPLKLDIAWPEKGGPYPIIVYFHGGGWATGDKLLFRHRMRMMAQSGYVVFNANYRLTTNESFPAQVNDVMGAVIFAKEKAHIYNGDPERVAVMGDSSGAHLASMVALAWDDPYFQPSYKGDGIWTAEVQAGVFMYGGYRLERAYKENYRLWGAIITRPLIVAFVGGTPEQMPKEYEKASPASYLGRDDIPPFFIMCGTEDSVYPESIWLHETLEERGIEHTAFFVDGEEHEFNYLEARTDFPYLRAILDFLDRNLKEVKPLKTADKSHD